ncbi:MAG TPA: glycosyltransferase [Bryobacteraceae bacterium]|nr:glycosyltransferase [Bryobacteraceae bacterium]
MPPLSIVIATTQPWPEMRGALESLYDQARAIPAEIIVADGHGRGQPDSSAPPFPGVIWITSPGASVYELRAMSVNRTSGEIIALTEDHCRVSPDWCAKILAAHQEYPEAGVIGGAVENGATESLMDWASFFYANGAAMLPLQRGKCRLITQLNLSYKRRAISGEIRPSGEMEWMMNEELRRRGETLVADGRIVVSHVQSLGFLGTCLLHFHGSRTLAGFRRRRIGWPELLIRLVACAAMPPLLFARALGTVLAKRRMLGTIVASTPFLALLVCLRAAGAFAGFVTGPGDSARYVR